MKGKKIKVGKATAMVIVATGLLSLILIVLVVLFVAGKQDERRQMEQMDTEITNMTLETFQPLKEIVMAGPYENKVQFGNSIITLPCELGVLLENGAQVSDAAYSYSYLVQAGDTMSLPMYLGNMEFTATVENTSLDTQKLYQCQVSGLAGITGFYVTFAGGIVPGRSTFDDVSKNWGSSGSSEDSNTDDVMLSIIYYRDGIPAKDIYAYKDGGTTVNSASQILDVGGYSYMVSYDRSSGVVLSVSAKFNTKAGIGSFRTMTYQFKGVDVIFDVLTDSYDIGNDMLYCVENIGGVDYVIAAGAIAACYDEGGTLLGEQSGESSGGSTELPAEGISALAKSYLTYSNYDFSEDFVVNIDTAVRKSYSGVSCTDSIYFCVDAELQKKEACSFAFYMHPVNRSDKITKEARAFMDSYVQRVRESLLFT